MRRRTVLVGIGKLSAAVLAGCGRKGSGIVGPSGDPIPVSVISGRTEIPVPSLGGLFARTGEELRLEAPGYFTFNTAFVGAPILMWPADDGFLSSHHTRAMVYGGKDPGTLCRLPISVNDVALVPDSNFRAFPWAMKRIANAADTLSQVHPKLNFTTDGPGFKVSLTVNLADPGFQSNPKSPAIAYTKFGPDGIITDARIVFRNLQIAGYWWAEENFQTAVVHEVIHATGLDHATTEDPPGIMSTTEVVYEHRAPTEREMLIMKMQYERLPGTVLRGMVEQDPGVSAKEDRPEWHLVCAL